MAKDVYEARETTFRGVNAYVVLDRKGPKDRGQLAANIQTKNGAAMIAYVHFLGLKPQRAIAKGHGYRRDHDAITQAGRKIRLPDSREERKYWDDDMRYRLDRFKAAMNDYGGTDWKRALEENGFEVFSAFG